MGPWVAKLMLSSLILELKFIFPTFSRHSTLLRRYDYMCVPQGSGPDAIGHRQHAIDSIPSFVARRLDHLGH